MFLNITINFQVHPISILFFVNACEMNTTPNMQQIPHSASYLAVSREQMFHVLDYSPLMGCSGTTVTIDTLFKHCNPSSDIHIRIVIGCKPIPTHIENIGGDKWRCTGSAPDFIAQKYPLTHTVNISIEAVVSRNVVVDSVAFGYFTYREYGKPTVFLFEHHRPEAFWQIITCRSRYILAPSMLSVKEIHTTCILRDHPPPTLLHLTK